VYSALSESTEQETEEAAFEGTAEEIIVEVPIIESGSYLYVCSQCGADLTEIPYYNRYYCQNCGLHY
jgi:anaerobic ribonucleoside-triphosphate reductase